MNIEPIRPDRLTIGIGFDQSEAVAYHVLCHSILSRSSIPVRFIPIKRTLLRSMHTRKIEPEQSNEFSFTRFLLPHLCDHEGVSLFMDCDILCRTDIARIFDHYNPFAAVHVVKHDYTPKTSTKYLGNVQHRYPRKNWSSVMLFNNALCRKLTPSVVEKASGAELHQFKLFRDESIAELPKEWNHLVTEMPPNPDAKLVHWTIGGPWFDEYKHAEFSDEWFRERALTLGCSNMDRSAVA